MRTLSTLGLVATLAVSGLATAQGRDDAALDVEDTEIDEEAILAALEQQDPQTFDQLVRLRDRDSKLYKVRLLRARDEMQLRRDRPELFRAEDELATIDAHISELLAARETAEDAGERAAIAAEIEDIADRVYDLRMEAYQARIARAQLRIDELKAQLEDRRGRRDQLIDEWLDERLGDDR